MAELNAFFSGGGGGGIDEDLLSADIYQYGSQFQWVPIVAPTAFMGYRVNSAPVDPERELRPSFMTGSYYGDYYNRIHIKPSSVDLGNLLGSTYTQYTVWNAFNVQKNMVAASYVGGEGINVTTSREVPGVMQPNEEIVFNIEATLDGPATVQAEFSYEFSDANDVTITITGRRVVVWPFMPETNVREAYEFSTDILKSYNKEQRISLRLAPRQSLEYVFKSLPNQFARMKLLAKEWTHRRYGVPVWYEATKLGAVAANSTTLNFSTASADYRVGGLALVWDDDLVYEAVEVTEVSAGNLKIKRPLTGSYQSAMVAPMRLGYTASGVSFSRTGSDLTNSTVRFEIVDNVKLSLTSPPTTYKGYYALTDYTMVVGSMDEQVSRELDVLDNTSGVIHVDTLSNIPVRRAFTTSVAKTKADRWKAKTWYHYLNGKQKAFWLPTWNKDLELVEPILSSSQTMVVRYTGFAKYMGTADILVKLKSGTAYLNRVLSGELAPGNRENLILESAFPANILLEDVQTICYLNLMRLDSDTIEFSYSNGVMETNVTTVGVVE